MTAAVAGGLPVLAHLQLTDAGRRRLDEVLQFLDRLDAAEHALAKPARTQLVEQLLYLDGFGGPVSETDARRRFQVTLGSDLYPLSFTVTWRSLDHDTGEYVPSMYGGLVWHGGPGDGGSVSLDPSLLWGVHT